MNVSIDTRTLKPGDIFIPIKGPNFDGHNFIDQAIAKGASRILDVDLSKYAARYRKKLTCHVIAVTGSAGKTTTKDMLYAILSQKYRVVRTVQNQNNDVGVPLTILSADANTDILIVEMGMRARGEIARLTRLVRPTHSIITNVGVTHIELLGTQRHIALAKAEIFQRPLAHETMPRYAFINHASAYHELLTTKAQKSGYKVLAYGGEDRLDQGFNLYHAVGHHFGLSDDQISAGIAQFESSAHRLKIHQKNGVMVIDDTYNANPDGVAYALQFLKRQPGRKVLVLGNMEELGEHTEKAHQSIVPLAVDAGVSILFCVGAKTASIRSDDMDVVHFPDQTQLQSALKSELRPGDVVLIKGSRSMRMEDTVDAVLA